ncbi:hypothetical protein RN001_006415 [Aquatica leii]|uniref:DUF4806 domain-containing protein n=1 Tax=Aquatica leii TaxID=1421715 RepID=A0AAN7SBE9_9COLE|nr:hypothetical protein RN001_006415 [Aquatica leii]
MYYVIEFDTGEIEVVPCNWVNNNMVPWKTGTSGLYAKKHFQPKSGWTKYKCTVRYRNQQFATYEEALEKCKFIVEHTDSSEVDEDTRTRKLKQNPDYHYFRDSEVDELPDFPGPVETCTKSTTSRSSSVSERLESEISDQRSNGTPTQTEIVPNNVPQQTLNLTEVLPAISITDLTFPSCKCDDTKQVVKEEISSVKESLMGDIDICKNEIRQLIKAVKLNTDMLERFIVQSKREWDAIKLDAQRPREINNRVCNQECELLFQGLLPLAKMEDIDAVNELLNEEDNKTFFINKMRRIGDIQRKCNWSGANEKYRLKGSNLSKMLMDILVEEQMCTYEAAEGHMKYVFQHTYDRQKHMLNEKNKKK